MKTQAAQSQRRILLFGEKVYGVKPKFSLECCSVDAVAFPKEWFLLSELSQYDLVILDYAAFEVERNIYTKNQEVFQKQMLDALDKGTSFCILHYSEDVPEYDASIRSVGNMDENGITRCHAQQIGFRWLLSLMIRPYRLRTPMNSASLKRSEFQSYLNRWGASMNVFLPYDTGVFDDVIFLANEGYASGFVSSVRKGKIFFLPCQRDFNRPNSVHECLAILITSILTYLTKTSSEIPAWAKVALFPQETQIQNELASLQAQIDRLQETLHPYQLAKSLASLSEYEFQKAVPQFFITHLGLEVFSEERYQEDFWILDANRQKAVIVETKTRVGGLKRGDVYSIYRHRESNDLDKDFPALLVMNTHLNANSWKEKIRPIDTQDYRVAAQDNILIVRVEDLLLFWNLIVTGQKSSEELLAILLSENGWLEVTTDGKITIHK